MNWRVSLLAMLGIVVLCGVGSAQETKKAVGPSADEWNKVADKAIDYLKKNQDAEGSWSGKKSPGITGVALTGMLKTGKVTAKDPAVEKALKYIEGLINKEAGHLAGKDPKVQLQNYVTCINVMALCSADRESYKAVVGDATKFLKKLQWDEGENKDKKDDFYGGAGYDSKSRPDLSNTQIFLDALIEAGIDKNDPALTNALIFVKRCQNFKGEGSDQPWQGKIDDGSFIYSPAAGGATKVADEPINGTLPGYGSMTYAGIKSMMYCGVSKDDPRVKKALEWISKNYTVDVNPGMPKARAEWGLYYYYNTMAKCLDVMGIDEVVDAQGKKHDWRAEITAALAKKQKDDGSWSNDADRWMENDTYLVTGYALMALSHCKPKK